MFFFFFLILLMLWFYLISEDMQTGTQSRPALQAFEDNPYQKAGKVAKL